MRVIEASESAPTGRHRVGMRDQGPAGEVVTEGTYRCANCGKELAVRTVTELPLCARCGDGLWRRSAPRLIWTRLVRRAR